jgi:hypothetical protein
MSDPEIDRAEEAEALAMERHDAEHPGDPRQYWGECEICAERGDELELEKAIANDIYYQEHERKAAS